MVCFQQSTQQVTGAQGPQLCCTARAAACPSLTPLSPSQHPQPLSWGLHRSWGWFGKDWPLQTQLQSLSQHRGLRAGWEAQGQAGTLLNYFLQGVWAHKVLGGSI